MTHETKLTTPEAVQPDPLPIPDGLTVEALAAIEQDPVGITNAEMLQSDAYDRVASFESMGGTAGVTKIDGYTYSCIGVSGYADRQTGQIITFANPQNVNTEIVQNNGQFTIRVAMWSVTDPNPRTTFVELHHEGKISPEGLSSIVNGAALVNQQVKNQQITQ